MNFKIFKEYPRTFWIANTIELFERWAWYGFFMVFSLYLVNSSDTGALGFSQVEKGMIMGIGTAILYFLPVITGAIADRFGYKRVLLISFVIYIIAFMTMPIFKNFWSVFAIYILLAVGGALFKPIVTATVSKTTNDSNSSVGFGLFYMMVNIGAFIGPLFSSKLREDSWSLVFYMSASIMAVNFILVWLFYREPGRVESNAVSILKSITTIFKNIIEALSDMKFVIFLIIISGFWTMYFQLFFSLPIFIEQWVDTRPVYDFIHSISPWLAERFGKSDGTISSELITNFDSFFIILFQVVISSFVMRFRPVRAMTAGILIASIGIGLTFVTQNGLFVILAILMFGIGEMASSPKTNEYVGKIAPPSKIALYMGCNYLPIAAGNFFAGFISGSVYQNISDKITLLNKEAVERNFLMPEISKTFTQNDYMDKFSELSGLNVNEITQLLWDKYNPSSIWIIITGIGLISAISLFIYDKFLLKTKTSNNIK